MLRFPAQTNRGYALIEILLAFGISVVVILAMVSLAVVTIKAGTTNRAYAEAGKIAQSQAEQLKLVRDTSNWSGLTGFWETVVKPCSSTPCYFDLVTRSLVKGSAGSVGTAPSTVNFSFSTSYNPLDVKQFTYTVNAAWTISNTPKSYRIQGLLSDWKAL